MTPVGDPIDHTQTGRPGGPLALQDPEPHNFTPPKCLYYLLELQEILHKPPGALLMRGPGPHIQGGSLELCLLQPLLQDPPVQTMESPPSGQLGDVQRSSQGAL